MATKKRKVEDIKEESKAKRAKTEGAGSSSVESKAVWRNGDYKPAQEDLTTRCRCDYKAKKSRGGFYVEYVTELKKTGTEYICYTCAIEGLCQYPASVNFSTHCSGCSKDLKGTVHFLRGGLPCIRLCLDCRDRAVAADTKIKEAEKARKIANDESDNDEPGSGDDDDDYTFKNEEGVSMIVCENDHVHKEAVPLDVSYARRGQSRECRACRYEAKEQTKIVSLGEGADKERCFVCDRVTSAPKDLEDSDRACCQECWDECIEGREE